MSETTTGKKGISQRTVFIIIAILLLLAGGGTAYYYFIGPGKEKRKLKKEAEEIKKKDAPDKTVATDKPEKTDQSQPRPSGNDNWPLQKGSVGERVLYLKRAVNRILPVGYAKLKEDTVFDDLFYKTLITKLGTRFYPVTEDIWIEVMQKSNQLVK
ncbi:MAG: hypothetical protein V4721_16570 [Bacteroidota bacterium]